MAPVLPPRMPWAAPAAMLVVRPLSSGVKVGLLVVPRMATGMPLLRAAPVRPPGHRHRGCRRRALYPRRRG